MIDLTRYTDGGYPQGIPFDSPVIHFYAIFILIGAVLALLLSDYRAYKEGYDPSFFNIVFLIAFPCGIIGARIWYVIASWSQEFANQPFYHVFEIWNGGLAIQGGAIAGVLSGVLFVKFARKGMPVLKACDLAVPTILIAQAIGRWGNFFNSEVFGHAVSSEAWSFLPNFITDNMIGKMSAGVVIPDSSVAAPLFLVEGIINLMFYFVITKGVTMLEGHFYEDGDQAFCYFIAYGFVRLILEPLRNPAFIMGEENGDVTSYNSLIMAIVFIAIGALLIALNHILKMMSKLGMLDNVPIINKFIAKRETIDSNDKTIDEDDSDKIDASIPDEDKDGSDHKENNQHEKS